MKKLVTFLFLLTSIVCFGQNKDFLKDVSGINFYGVDYSAAKVFGAAESPQEFKIAFDKMNQLFITEAKKYDVGKRLKKKVNQISLTAVDKVNGEINPDELMTTNQEYTLSEEEIKQVVDALPIQQEPGIGLVIIAKLLNKAKAYGSYQVVFFNTQTKEIVKDWATGGRARGFGLRNYWAGSIHKVVNSL